MLTEGHPEVCEDIEAHGGVAALVGLLCTGGGQGKKSAAEALQAMAAENESSKVSIAAGGAIRPLTAMVRDGEQPYVHHRHHWPVSCDVIIGKLVHVSLLMPSTARDNITGLDIAVV